MADRKDYEVSVTSNQQQSIPDGERRLYEYADKLDAKLGIRFWMLAGLVLVSLVAGTPHILVHYQCYGRCGQNAREFNCQYFGVRGWNAAEPSRDKCPRVRLL